MDLPKRPTPTELKVIQRGVIRRSGSKSELIKSEIAKLTSNYSISFNFGNSNTILKKTFSPQEPLNELLKFVDKKDLLYLPDYGVILDKSNYTSPLWSLGFYDGIEVVVITTKNIKRKETSNTSIIPASVKETDKIQVVSSQIDNIGKIQSSQKQATESIIQESSNDLLIDSSGHELQDTNNSQIITPNKSNQVPVKSSQPITTSTQLSQPNNNITPQKPVQDQTVNEKQTEQASKKSNKFQFVVKGPEVKVIEIELTESFEEVFDYYTKLSQGKKPVIKFKDKILESKDTPESIDALSEHLNVINVSMVEDSADSPAPITLQDTGVTPKMIRIGMIESSAHFKAVYFNAKEIFKVKKICKKYSKLFKIPEDRLDFYYEGNKLDNSTMSKTLKEMEFKSSGNQIVVKLKDKAGLLNKK